MFQFKSHFNKIYIRYQVKSIKLRTQLFTGEKIVVFLNMSAQNLPPVVSRNTIAEIKGSEYPKQVNDAPTKTH